MGVRRQIFLALPPGALGRGQNKYHLISISKSISKIFLYHLCVFSQMKDTKHIKRDFHSVAWVMPPGVGLGALEVPRGSNFCFKNDHVAYHIDGDDEQNRMQVKFLS